MKASKRSRKPLGRPLMVVALLVFTIVTLAPAGAAQGELQIETRDGKVWLEADGADLRSVLQQLASAANFKLWVSASLPLQTVDIRSDGKSLEKTLQLVLDEISYAMVYDDNAAVSELYVLPAGESRSSTAALSATDDDGRQKVLLDALQSDQLPDIIKAAMLDQYGAEQEISQQSAAQMQSQAIQTLIDTIETIGAPDSATMLELRRGLERVQESQAEQ